MVTKIYGRFSESFILIIVDDMGLNDTQAFIFSRILSTISIVETYSIKRPIILLAKNVGNFMSSEQQLLTNFSTIFINHVFNVATIERLAKVHNKHNKG